MLPLFPQMTQVHRLLKGAGTFVADGVCRCFGQLVCPLSPYSHPGAILHGREFPTPRAELPWPLAPVIAKVQS